MEWSFPPEEVPGMTGSSEGGKRNHHERMIEQKSIFFAVGDAQMVLLGSQPDKKSIFCG